jgi:hypothetical protein
MAVTSPVYKNRACVNGPAGLRRRRRRKAGLKEADLQSISHYLALVAVPAQRSIASGFPKGVAPIDELTSTRRWSPPAPSCSTACAARPATRRR